MPIIYRSGGPGSFLVLLVMLALLALVFVVLPANIAAHAARGLGLTPLQGLALLAAMLLTRNVDYTVFRSEHLVREVLGQGTPLAGFFRVAGMPGSNLEEHGYGDELVRQSFAVSLGGLVLPLAMTVFFAARMANEPGALAWTVGAAVIAAAVCFAVTTYPPAQGPRLPLLLPPFCAVLAGLMLQEVPFAASAAFAAAVLGPILGSGVLPLLFPAYRNRVDIPRLVLGGGATFWGIFFGCIAAGLVA